MKKRIMLLAFLFVSVAVFSQSSDIILGKWLNNGGEAHIQIYKKGNNYFGKLVWLKKPNDEAGKVKVDIKNPDVKLKNRPILGLEILQDLKFADGEWEGGTIYDPKSGKTYSCKITANGNDKIDLRGYIGFSFIGRSETWSKVK